MGGFLSKTEGEAQSSNTQTAVLSSSSQNQKHARDLKSQTEATHPSKTLEAVNPIDESSDSDPSKTLENQAEKRANVEEEEEEQGECGFCLFMKGGGCKDAFIAWQNCVEEKEKSGEDIVEKCFEVTAALRKCMGEHSDYYGPLLEAEKTIKLETAKAKEKERESGGEGGLKSQSELKSKSEVMSSEGSEEEEKEKKSSDEVIVQHHSNHICATFLGAYFD